MAFTPVRKEREYGRSPVAMTNEERFIVSCESVGEADVRQKLNADRYTGRRALWASTWLEQVESSKSESTRAEERSSSLLLAKPNRQTAYVVFAVVCGLLIGGLLLFQSFR
jgi:hypothetical protein